jgi:hypothetical protein
VVLKKEDPDGSTANASEAGIVKANKGMILRKSVEYIRCVILAVAPFSSPYVLQAIYNSWLQPKALGIVSSNMNSKRTVQAAAPISLNPTPLVISVAIWFSPLIRLQAPAMAAHSMRLRYPLPMKMMN